MVAEAEYMEKTNVMRILDQKKIGYTPRSFDPKVTQGVSVAELLGEEAEKVFKTLVTVSDKGAHFVFVIPVAENLDLKKAAKAVGAKSVSMLKQKELFPLTGYVHGGCSPVGMKKLFTTVIDTSAQQRETMCVSAGRVGTQVELAPQELANLVRASFCELTVKGE